MNLSPPSRPFLNSSRRTLAEQTVGLGIIALGSFLFAVLEMTFFREGSQWVASLNIPFWKFSDSYTFLALTAVHSSLALSFWILWRSFSLRVLKLELSLFLSMFVLESIWGLSLFKGHETLPALFTLLLWMSTEVLLAVLFWKKEKIAGMLFFFPLLWIFYLISTNMVLCIANP
ncbi:MAG TPA: TspO/MBR family protein [Chlamydiales bacterium]|jgi:tryptophan-rich sensory protein|nr:TspO/MBR family protein [Chlamydiales bacterium]